MELISEIKRINKLMGANPKTLIIESDLILEASIIDKVTKGIEKLLDQKAIEYAESVLPRSVEPNIEKRIENFILQNLNTAVGKTQIRNLIKGLATNSPTFAEKFAEKNKLIFNKLSENPRFGKQGTKNIIINSYGEEIANAWEKSLGKTKPRTSPSITTPTSIPKELKDTNGIKKFQTWLNETYPTWNQGKRLSTEGKAFGTYGQRTKLAWELHSEEYGRFLLREKAGRVGLETEEEIDRFTNWLKDTGRWNEETYNQNKGLTDLTKKAWELHEKAYRETIGYRKNLEVSLNKLKAGDIKPVKGGWWDSKLSFLHPATKYTVFNSVRKSLYFYYMSIRVIAKDKQVQIDEIISKLLTAIEMNKLDYRSSQDLFRDISIQMAALRRSADQKYEYFLKDVQKILVDSGLSYENVNSVIADLKSYSAFEKMFDKKQNKDPRWIVEIWKTSSVKKALSGLTEEWTPFWIQSFKKILNGVERSLMFLSTGNIRTLSEITDFMIESGINQGIKNYVGVCYVMKLLILPSFFTLVQFVWLSVKNIYNPEYGFWAKEWGELWNQSNQFNIMWEKLVGGELSLLLPWSWYWDNLDKFGDDVAQQKIGKDMRDKLSEIEQKYNIKKQQADSLLNVVNDRIKSTKQKAEDIVKISKDKVSKTYENTPAGFEQFTKDNKYTIKKSLEGGVGQTVEEDRLNKGKTWWYFDTGTFKSY